MQDLFNTPADCEILSSRIFDYPPSQVFRAWTDPDILQKWWGPAGHTNTFHKFELTPGGRWTFTMHGPGGKGNYENDVVFLKIEEPSFIAWNRLSQPLFRVVTTFDEAPGGTTKLTFRMQFATKEECDKIRKFAPDKNEENFDKLEVELQKMIGDQ